MAIAHLSSNSTLNPHLSYMCVYLTNELLPYTPSLVIMFLLLLDTRLKSDFKETQYCSSKKVGIKGG